MNPQGTSISFLFARCFIVGIFDEQYGFVSAMLNQNSFAFVGCFNELFICCFLSCSGCFKS